MTTTLTAYRRASDDFDDVVFRWTTDAVGVVTWTLHDDANLPVTIASWNRLNGDTVLDAATRRFMCEGFTTQFRNVVVVGRDAGGSVIETSSNVEVPAGAPSLTLDPWWPGDPAGGGDPDPEPTLALDAFILGDTGLLEPVDVLGVWDGTTIVPLEGADAPTPAPPEETGLPPKTRYDTGLSAIAALPPSTPLASGTYAASNVTLTDRTVNGDLTVTGSSVTLQRVKVTGHLVIRGADVALEDSDVGSLALSGCARPRIRRVAVVGNMGQDGVHITSDAGQVSDVVIEDSWIGNPTLAGGSHYDGFQIRGVAGCVIRRCNVQSRPGDSRLNAALFVQDVNGGSRDVTVEDSLLTCDGYYVMRLYGTRFRLRRVKVSGTAPNGSRPGALISGSTGMVEVVDVDWTDGTQALPDLAPAL